MLELHYTILHFQWKMFKYIWPKKYFNNFYISCKANDYIIYLTFIELTLVLQQISARYVTNLHLLSISYSLRNLFKS